MPGTRQILVTGARPTPLVRAGDGPTLLYNQDPNNELLIGDSEGMSATQSGSSSVFASQASLVVDGKTDKWAIPPNPANQSLVSVIPGGLQLIQIGGT